MQTVHSLGIIHRNLKPAKILLDEEMRAKVGGFGVSKHVSLNEQTQSMTHGIGDYMFMAPELIDEAESYNEKVDVYSFGFIVFFIHSFGRLPSLKKFASGEIDWSLSINEFAKDLIERCWSKCADNRPSFKDIFNDIEKNGFMLKIKFLINLKKEEI